VSGNSASGSRFYIGTLYTQGRAALRRCPQVRAGQIRIDWFQGRLDTVDNIRGDGERGRRKWQQEGRGGLDTLYGGALYTHGTAAPWRCPRVRSGQVSHSQVFSTRVSVPIAQSRHHYRCNSATAGGRPMMG